jgi:long-chain fatty acid transport protein
MKKILLTASTVTVAATSAFAGGFERSGNPVGFMFETGNYAELSFGYVEPSVSGNLVPAPTVSSGNVLESYSQVGFAIKTDVNEKISIGLQVDPTFGADIFYPTGTGYPIGGANAELNGDTVAVIGRYKFNDSFSAHVGLRSVGIGGNVGGGPLPNTNYDTDRSLGYLVGAAFEKKEIALRVALTYQSSTDHTLTTRVNGALVPAAVFPQVELPQSLTLDFQSGVAANTLVFGSIRWVDWTETALNFPTALVNYDNDSITYNIGVGRKFNEQWSGAVSIGYEKSNGGIQSNLSPTDGYVSVGLGATYTTGNVKITGGVRYVDIGDATSLSGNGNFSGNSAVAVGLKVGYTF